MLQSASNWANDIRGAYVVTALLAVMSLVVAGVVVNAQSNQDTERITLSPATQRYDVKNGDTFEDKVTVINDGQTDYTFSLYARPFSVQDVTYEPDFTKESERSDVHRWVKFEKTSYELSAGDRVDVPYSVSVPEGSSSGGHYGVIFAEIQPENTEPGSVVRKKRVGSIVYVTVDGVLDRQGRFESTNVPFWQFSTPLVAKVNASTDGNVDVPVDLTMQISDVFGDVKYTGSQRLTMLPDTSRSIQLEWPQSASFGLYKVGVSGEIVDDSIDETHYVLMMPRWMLILLAVIVLAGVLYGTRKAFKSKKRKR